MDLAGLGVTEARLLDMVRRLQRVQTRNVSAATTVTAADDVLLVDTSGGSVTVTLPDAKQHANHRVDIKKMTAANTLTVQRSGSDTIDGAVSTAWTTQYQSVTFQSALVTAPATWGWVKI